MGMAALAGFAVGVPAARAQDDLASSVRVTGIVVKGPLRLALLEFPSRRNGPILRPILRAGEKAEQVEVVSIDDRQGVVVVKVGEATSAFPVEGGHPQTEPRTFNVRGADIVQMLEVYQEFSGRTVVRDGSLPGVKVDLRTDGVLLPADAVRALESALNKQGIVAVPVGDKFVAVLRAEEMARANELPPLSVADNAEVLPAGMIKFREADVVQVLDIYQELAGRTVLRSPRLRGKISVRSQTRMTRAEAIWLLEIALQLNGTRTVRDGERFVFAVRHDAKNPALPAFKSNAVLVPPGGEPLSPGRLRFSEAGLEQVLGVYAELCKRKAAALDGRVPAARISIRSQTSLTAAESVYALDALAAMSGVEFVPVGEDEITVRPKVSDGAGVVITK